MDEITPAEAVISDETENTTEIMEDIDEQDAPEAENQDIVKLAYEPHGGDPRELDLSNCILAHSLPSALLDDEFEVFDECIRCLFADEFATSKSAIEKIIRIPRLAENSSKPDYALRAIVSFKVKLHKHRLLTTKKKEIEQSGIEISAIEKLPREFIEFDEECHEDFEVDEVGDDETQDHEDHDELGVDHETSETVSLEANEKATKEENGSHNGDAKEGEKKASKSSTKKSSKKVYVDEDRKAPFETVWEGAPEFQWKIVEHPRDRTRLTLENLYYSDLTNPFIYRTMIKAESVEIRFPMRFNHFGTKEMHGTMHLNFAENDTIMDEAMKHLIYVRTSNGRRIKIYLPQTSHAIKSKKEFEKKLGRVIKPTPRMHQLVIKPIPEEVTPVLDDACKWFPNQSVIDCHLEKDEEDKPCAVVKFETVEETITAHSSTSTIHFEDEAKTKGNVYMRGVEVHYGSLLALSDSKRRERERRKDDIKERRDRGATIADPEPKRRPPIITPPMRGRGVSRGLRGGYVPRGRGAPVNRRPLMDSRPPYRTARSPPRTARYDRSARSLEDQLSAKRTSLLEAPSFGRRGPGSERTLEYGYARPFTQPTTTTTFPSFQTEYGGARTSTDYRSSRY